MGEKSSQIFDFFLTCRYYRTVAISKGVDMVWQVTSRQELYRLVLISAITLALFLPAVGSLEGGIPTDLTLLDLNGKKVRLTELTEDKPLLLYFWATWCKPCRLTTPKVSALAHKYKDRITVLGINVGGVDSVKDVRKYRKRYKVTYPLLLDSNNDTVAAYSVRAIPVVILLDETGRILFRDNDPPANLEQLLPQ